MSPKPYITSRILIVDESQGDAEGCVIPFYFAVEIQDDSDPNDYPVDATVSFLAYDSSTPPIYISPDPMDVTVDYDEDDPKHCDSPRQELDLDCSALQTSPCTLIINPADDNGDFCVQKVITFTCPCAERRSAHRRQAALPCSPPVVEINIRVTGGTSAVAMGPPCGGDSHLVAPRIKTRPRPKTRARIIQKDSEKKEPSEEKPPEQGHPE